MRSKLKTFIVAITSIGLIISLGVALPAAGQVVISDDFNDYSLDLKLWTAIIVGEPGTVTETVGRLELSVDGQPNVFQLAGVSLNVPFNPDNFDVQVDYELLDWPLLQEQYASLLLFAGEITAQSPYLLGRLNDGQPYPSPQYSSSSFSGVDHEIFTLDTAGRLRLVGSSRTLSAYYWDWDGDMWQLLSQEDFPEPLDQYRPCWIALALIREPLEFTEPVRSVKIAFDNFTVTGQPAVDVLITRLIQDVMALNVQKGIRNSLNAKLEAVLNALDNQNANNDVAAVNAMRAFINAAEAQRGNKLTEADADRLVAAAQIIILALGVR